MRFLHLEDNANDQILVREMLQDDGLASELVVVTTSLEFESALQLQPFDLIISDFSLPSFDGLRALAIARKLSPQTPFIFFSGTIGEEVAVESLRHGATDYVLKQRPQRLAGAVRSALRSKEERVRLAKMEGELRQMEERLRIVARAWTTTDRLLLVNSESSPDHSPVASSVLTASLICVGIFSWKNNCRMFFPIASKALQPYMRSAPLFQ